MITLRSILHQKEITIRLNDFSVDSSTTLVITNRKKIHHVNVDDIKNEKESLIASSKGDFIGVTCQCIEVCRRQLIESCYGVEL